MWEWRRSRNLVLGCECPPDRRVGPIVLLPLILETVQALGLAWSRRVARAHTAEPEFVAAEIDRYIALPGQALGYLVGQREILRLREYARARLGVAFDLRAFHGAVLDHGSLPLPVLSQVVQAWVTSVAAD
jgi:hypothetical protein